MTVRLRAALLALGVATACNKVPLTDIGAEFIIADAAWFAAEETLFVFYRVDAEQGIEDVSRIEIRFTTDDEVVPWTPLQAFEPVHTHLDVECRGGGRSLCGSTSIHVRLQPRDVELRLRYHPDGPMSRYAMLRYNAIGEGPAHSNRSLLVYGVFNDRNDRIQWRARHQFPTLRNEEVQALGLRRWFAITDLVFGDVPLDLFDTNPYGYAFATACPAGMPAVGGLLGASTEDRAVFEPATLGVETSQSSVVCARATVHDATGELAAPALARKNPQVRAAFPALRSPIVQDREIGFLLTFCNRSISPVHEAMQVQRLELETEPTFCIDDWQQADFTVSLESTFIQRFNSERVAGEDMILKLAVHHDDRTGALVSRVEEVLHAALTPEASKSSPRVVGAFILDSYAHELGDPNLTRQVLWCPSSGENTTQQSCARVPDIPDLRLGPFSFNVLPILPTRGQYLDFIDKYSEAQAGKVTALRFLAPERTPTSRDVPLGDVGIATFFNSEIVSAQPTDAFSVCPSEALQLVVFQVPGAADPLPLDALPELHEGDPQATYALGRAWDFPFLTRMDYQITLAGSATAFSLSVPFGISGSTTDFHGSQLWTEEELRLGDAFLQCSRFCRHPTFDSAGVYNVLDPFEPGYRHRCYAPRYPRPGDGGFPDDP